jgi:hypothetical protein
MQTARSSFVLAAALGFLACADSADPATQDGSVFPPTGQGHDAGSPPLGGGGPSGSHDSGLASQSDGGGGGVGGGDGDAAGPPHFDGPDDGDPSKPVVTVSGVACGPAQSLGIGTANLQIGGKDVLLTYPCDKHEGAHVTVILLLHGTMATEQLKFYTHDYFAAYKLATSHNLIVIEPKAVGSQWGNGDNGADKPHLYEVIDWVYQNFSKYQLTGLWVAGHSWGAMYAKTFVCDDMLKQRVRGVVGMSGGTSTVGGGIGGVLGGGGSGSSDCAARVSQIHTVGDMDMVTGLPDQSSAAANHGCGAKMGPTDLGDMQMESVWPNCQPGWVHSEFTMGDHTHTTPINAPVVQNIVEQIKSTEK